MSEEDVTALAGWLSPTQSSQVDRILVADMHAGWTPERVDELPLSAAVAVVRSVGVVDPVLLRPRAAGGFEMVTGHRTVAAAREAGLERVPAVVRQLDDGQALTALALDGTATGRLTRAAAAELRGRMGEAGLAGEDVEDIMAAVPVEADAPATVPAPGVAETPAAAPPAIVAAPPGQLLPGSVPEARPEPAGQPAPREAEGAAEPVALPQPEPVALPQPEPVAAAPEPQPVAAPRPELEPVGTAPAAGAPAATRPTPPAPIHGAVRAQSRWVPLPAGRPRLARLSSAFADAPRMLRLLAGDSFTGTVELVGADGRRDSVTFLEGACIAVSVEEDGARIEAALRLPAPDRGPTVEVTVRPHPAPVVIALALALRAPARLVGLDASFLHLPGLLTALSRTGGDAAVVVSAPRGAGVVLISGGEPIAAYARREGEEPGEVAETSDVGAVADLLAGGEGEVDVHDGPLVAPLDLDEVIGSAVAGD